MGAEFSPLNGAVTRSCTVAGGGRITLELVNEKIDRLRSLWSKSLKSPDLMIVGETLGSEAAHALNLFDRIQLGSVLRVVSTSRSLSEAGRLLFANSREKEKQIERR